MWNVKGPKIGKTILKKKNQVLDFKTYYKATVIKTVWYWHKVQTCRSMEPNRECRNKPSHIWSNDFQQGCQDHSVFSKNGGKIGYPHTKEWSLTLTTIYKISSKWTHDLNIRPKTIKPLEENIGQNFMTLDLAMFFWIWHQRHKKQKKK